MFSSSEKELRWQNRSMIVGIRRDRNSDRSLSPDCLTMEDFNSLSLCIIWTTLCELLVLRFRIRTGFRKLQQWLRMMLFRFEARLMSLQRVGCCFMFFFRALVSQSLVTSWWYLRTIVIDSKFFILFSRQIYSWNDNLWCWIYYYFTTDMTDCICCNPLHCDISDRHWNIVSLSLIYGVKQLGHNPESWLICDNSHFQQQLFSYHASLSSFHSKPQGWYCDVTRKTTFCKCLYLFLCQSTMTLTKSKGTEEGWITACSKILLPE